MAINLAIDMIMNTCSALESCAFFDHLRAVTADARLLTGAAWGTVFGLMVAGILYLKSSRRHQLDLQQAIKTTVETRRELWKTASLYSVQCQVAEVSSRPSVQERPSEDVL